MDRRGLQNDETTDKTPLDATISAMPEEAMALKCPFCMAPLPPPHDPSLTELTCEYCGGTSTLRVAEEEMERLRNDVKNWIHDIASKAVSSSVSDSVSRQYIFNHDILARLKLEVDRAIEFYQETRFMPLLALPLFRGLKCSHLANERLASIGDKDTLMNVKNVVAKTESPDLLDFTVGDHEKTEMIALTVSCKEVIEFNHIRHGLSESTKEGFNRALKNIIESSNLHRKAAIIASAVNESYSKFMQSRSAWLSSVEKTVAILARLKEPGSEAPTELDVDELMGAAKACDQAASDMEDSGREKKETAPASEGCRDDARYIKILADAARICRLCEAKSGDDFMKFLDDLAMIADKSKNESDVIWLEDFLSNLTSQMAAMAGKPSSNLIIDDFEWANDLGKKGINKKWYKLSDAETFDIQEKLLVPFWVMDIQVSKQQGIIPKLRQDLGLLFVDATRQNGIIFYIKHEDPLFERCRNALISPELINIRLSAVVPLVTKDIAEKRIKMFIDSREDITSISEARFLYLPGAIARYKKVNENKERRSLLLKIDEQPSLPIDPSILHIGGQKLLLV